jgi:hypothetical protein
MRCVQEFFLGDTSPNLLILAYAIPRFINQVTSPKILSPQAFKNWKNRFIGKSRNHSYLADMKQKAFEIPAFGVE